MEKKGFHKRGFTSMMVFLSFLAMTVTGLILYFTPQGRIAYWVDWRFLGLTKTHWGNIHIITSIVFAAIGIYHLILNWRVFTAYIVNKLRDQLALKFEMGLALVLTVFFVVGSIFLVPPLNFVITFSEYLKDSWIETREYEPPFGHAEQLSLKVFTKKMDIPLDKALVELERSNIAVQNSSDRIEDIARANRTTSMEIYKLIKKFEPVSDLDMVVYTPEMVDEKFSGTGLGRMALPWLIDDLRLDPEDVRKRLEAQGIEISDTETLKQAASRYDIEPIDILKVILVPGYDPHEGSPPGGQAAGK